MYCPHCGEQIAEQAELCPKCNSVIQHSITSVPEDKSNIAINILSLCCIPILGIIMFFVWKDDKPKAAKSALIFGLIGFGIALVFSIIGFVLGIIDAMMYY